MKLIIAQNKQNKTQGNAILRNRILEYERRKMFDVAFSNKIDLTRQHTIKKEKVNLFYRGEDEDKYNVAHKHD